MTRALYPGEHADELIAVRCQLGERAAFDDLIRRWAGPLRRHALRATGDADVADELVQEIWLRVLQGFGRLRDCSRFRSWLFGIAHRVLMDRLRLHYALPVDPQRDPGEFALDDPERERGEVQRDIERGLRLLPLAEREVLTLFYLEELSLAEVGSILAVPIGTVKSRLFRARTLLRQQLDPESSHTEATSP